MLHGLQHIVDTFSNTVTSTVRLFVIGTIVIVAVLSLAGSLVAPVIADKAGEHAERISEKVIEAERQEMEAARREMRARELAKEGWGYSDRGSEDAARFEDERRREDDYWGARTE